MLLKSYLKFWLIGKKVSIIMFLFSVFFVRNGYNFLCKKCIIFVVIKLELLVWIVIFCYGIKSYLLYVILKIYYFWIDKNYG